MSALNPRMVRKREQEALEAAAQRKVSELYSRAARDKTKDAFKSGNEVKFSSSIL